MFVIRECHNLREYDLFLEEYALENKKSDLYPRCEGNVIVSIDQLPPAIRSEIENEKVFSSAVRWYIDLNEKKEITGKIEFVIETDSEWISFDGDFEDWQVFQKLSM